MANRNEIAFRLSEKQSRNYFDYGALRRARSFNYNNYERVLNDISGRLSSNPSQRLAVSQNFGRTRGLIIGGQRDGSPIASRGAPIIVQSGAPITTGSSGTGVVKVYGGATGVAANPRRAAEEAAKQKKKFEDRGLPMPY